MWILSFSILFFLCTSCETTEKFIYRDVDPKTQIVIQRETLDKLMNECIDVKIQLLDCLERERK